MKRGRKDVLLIAALLLVGLVLLLILRISRSHGAYVEVRVGGSVTAVYSLDEEGSYRIEGVDGGYNLLVISKGTATVTEADCPDKLCVGMGPIRYGGQSIICLPHEVVISLISEEPEIDEIAG